MAYAAVVKVEFLVEKFLSSLRPCFAPPCLKLLELAHKEIKSFQEFLSGLGPNTRKRINDSLREFTEVMDEFYLKVYSHLDDQVDSQSEIKKGTLPSLEMESLEEEFHLLFGLMKKIKKERFNGDADGNKSKMIGLSDVYNKLKRLILLDLGKNEIRYFSIVGMAGIGKTALAEAIFQDLDVMETFDLRVWVSVGKDCTLEEILVRILVQLAQLDRMPAELVHRDVETYIDEILERERWLIVLDDVWDRRILDLLVHLPHDKDGCRVIFTSRSKRVANDTYPADVRLLNEKESWTLLREKLFGERHCPPELEKVGKKIAEKCDGLPLTIVTVANLLLKIPESLWIDVATKRKHQVFIDAYDEISKVLYPSYEDLPRPLKLCFLYMAVFPPNYKISRSRIINMWFIENLLGANFSATACLEEFSNNSLVMVYQKRSTNPSWIVTVETKSCGLHSSWWHLCYTEARKENFFYVLTDREDRLGEDIESQSKISIHNNVLFAIKDVYDSIEMNSASTARSLLCLGPYHRYPVPICFGLGFLENLDALSIRLYEFPLEVLKLGGLKYLSVTCDGEFPASISGLQMLQFFIVLRHHNIKFHGAALYLPVEIWDMKELKHFQIMGSDLPDPLCDTILPNLSTLLDVSGHSCTKGLFARVPHLKKLGIQIELALDVAEPLRCFDHIFQLHELEILKCVVVNPPDSKFTVVSLPTSLSIFPHRLKKLTLSGLGYPWDEMSKIASLPCLEVLKLQCNAFQGPKWEVDEDGFLELSTLVIEDINLMQWRVGCGSFKRLKSISIKHCYKLKDVHWEFDAERISEIEVIDCNPLLEYKIRETLLRQLRVPDHFSVESSWEAKDVKT